MDPMTTFQLLERYLDLSADRHQLIVNNMANIDTPGYSREVLDLEENAPAEYGPLWFGTGVSADQVESIRDQMLQLSIDDTTQQQTNAQTQSTALQQVESLFSDPSQGLGSDLTAFFNSLNQLSTDPTSIPQRQSVLTAANNLANDFHTTVTQLDSIQQNLNLQVTQSVGQINQLTTQIAALNAQIAPLQQLGQSAGTLEDQRDELVQQLSQLTGVQVIQSDQGETLATANGSPLVVGNQSFALTTAPDASGMQHIFAEGTDITSSLTGGQLGGTLAVRDQAIPGVLSDLDGIASGLATNFNAAQAQGFDLNGKAGQNLFAPVSGTGAAAAFQVATTDPDAIAASSDGTAGSDGNLSNLLAVQNQTLASGETPIDDYSNLVFNVGNMSAQAQASATATQTNLQQLNNQLDSVSGVSIDEETANLIRFQNAYQASARVISTVDNLTQDLFTMIPTTG